MGSDLREIPLAAIKENPVALRTVDRKSESYLGLVASIRQKGFLGAITVRERQDEKSGESFFELIDGLHRFSAAKDAGLSTINVDVRPLSDDETMEAQLMLNIHKVETKPHEYSKQLKRILTRNPTMTEAELASRLGRSPAWIEQRLGLTKIQNAEIIELVNNGQITLSNAYALAKLPESEQPNFVQQAMELVPDEFVPLVNTRVKALKEAARRGEDPTKIDFTPHAFSQGIGPIKDENKTGEIGRNMIKKYKITDPMAAWNMAIAWVLHLDPDSVDVQREKYEARRREQEEAKQRRAAKRAEDKAIKLKEDAAKAAEAAVKAQEALAANG